MVKRAVGDVRGCANGGPGIGLAAGPAGARGGMVRKSGWVTRRVLDYPTVMTYAGVGEVSSRGLDYVAVVTYAGVDAVLARGPAGRAGQDVTKPAGPPGGDGSWQSLESKWSAKAASSGALGWAGCAVGRASRASYIRGRTGLVA